MLQQPVPLLLPPPCRWRIGYRTPRRHEPLSSGPSRSGKRAGRMQKMQRRETQGRLGTNPRACRVWLGVISLARRQSLRPLLSHVPVLENGMGGRGAAQIATERELAEDTVIS